MEKNSEIKKFIQENSVLSWWIKPEEKINISISSMNVPNINRLDT